MSDIPTIAWSAVCTPSLDAWDACAVLADILVERGDIKPRRSGNPAANRHRMQCVAFLWAREALGFRPSMPVYSDITITVNGVPLAEADSVVLGLPYVSSLRADRAVGADLDAIAGLHGMGRYTVASIDGDPITIAPEDAIHRTIQWTWSRRPGQRRTQ